MAYERIYNFSAGPAVLPIEVLETVRENLFNYQGSGLGVMELSHRGAHFDEIIKTAEASLRELLGISDDYGVIFVPGGATTQFAAVPMNLLGQGQTANYIVTGSWAEKAAKEARTLGEVHIAATSEDKNHSYIPEQLDISQNCAYIHYTNNNTIFGTQFQAEPKTQGNVLICDASSDFLYRKIDISKYGLIYAGAQKNLGPAGVTVVVIRKDLLERTPKGLPSMLDYSVHVSKSSLYNTPPTFPIYVVGEVFKWIKTEGGLGAMEQRNREKAQLLYDAIDASDFYECHAEQGSRSLMNVTFRLTNSELEKTFLEESNRAGFSGLKGHRSVGGMRASIYNAFPRQGVVDLVAFMKDFASRN